MHSETRQASLGHEILRILILKRIWQCKLQQIIIKSFLLWTKNSHQNDARGTLICSLSISCFVTEDITKILSITHLEHSIEQWHPCCPWGFPPRILNFPLSSDFRSFHSDEMEILWMFQKICDVSNSSYFDLTTWNSHGFEIKRGTVLSVIPNNRHPFLLPSVSGKDEIAIAIASPVFLRVQHGSGPVNIWLVLPMPEWIEIWYPQSINSSQTI